jgi:hypothetical protein
VSESPIRSIEAAANSPIQRSSGLAHPAESIGVRAEQHCRDSLARRLPIARSSRLMNPPETALYSRLAEVEATADDTERSAAGLGVSQPGGPVLEAKRWNA